MAIYIEKSKELFKQIEKKAYYENQLLFVTLHNKKCYNSCNYCYVSKVNKFENLTSEVSLFDNIEEYEKLLCQLKDIGVIKLCFSGGEPMLINDIVSKFILARKMGFDVNFITSGDNITEEMINVLANLGGSLTFSFNGSNAELHDKIVGKKGSFDNAKKYFFKALKKNVKLQINYLITACNYDNILDFYNKFNFGSVRINFTFKISPVIEAPLDFLEKLYLTEEQFFQALKNLELIGYINKDFDLTNFFSKLCNIGRTLIGIDEIGNVWPCISFRKVAGNIKNDNLRDILENSKVLKEIRNIKIQNFTCNDNFKKYNVLCIADNYLGSQYQNIYEPEEYSKKLANWMAKYFNEKTEGN